MMPAHEIAKYFVSLIDEDAGDSITNLKLQKASLLHARRQPCSERCPCVFPDPIEAWIHGPVVPNVYHAYKQHRGERIPVERVNLESYPTDIRELLNDVNDVFGQFSAGKLRTMTHNEPPWKDTPQGLVRPPPNR